ncbi:phage portal protein [Xanthobacteraceae bacterium Astr-EGSB]|uniref:phage portal protein n=1 Tax=Astrobacterium formosum TaxID=3069710 RepID=UPI0027B2E7FA|nr:phage portal protein [Xanthobacteraceae bacterium Astr-EGSB]
MNLLDEAISWFAPESGARRALARMALAQYRHYDAAMVGRRTANWRATNASANETTRGTLARVRARSRDHVRNTWWGARIVSVVKAHAVGTGITPIVKTGNKKLNKKALAAWRQWCRTCDAEGQLNFDGLVALATGCIVESGEVLGRLNVVAQRDPAHVPLELQLLEPDHLDVSRDSVRLDGALRVVDQGVEYDTEGKRLAYWILPEHPGARGLLMRGTSMRVPADEILHAYRKDRIGQGRGVPWLAPIALKGRDTADLEEAVVIKGRIEACLAAFIKTTNSGTTLANRTQTERTANNGSRRIETLSPGMIKYLDQGEDITTVSPSSSLAFESILMMNWLALAAGAGVTYDQLTGDLRRANYSSLRAGKIEFRRIIEQFQWLTLVAMFLDPLWDKWCAFAQDFGVLPRRAGGYPVEWIMPAVEPIDPLKDMQADVAAVRSGRMTYPQFCAAWGLDPEEQLDQIEAWMRDLDRRKITLETDPRVALNKGVPAPAEQQAGQDKGQDTEDEDNADDDQDA